MSLKKQIESVVINQMKIIYNGTRVAGEMRAIMALIETLHLLASSNMAASEAHRPIILMWRIKHILAERRRKCTNLEVKCRGWVYGAGAFGVISCFSVPFCLSLDDH
jgi:hypothetical protein